LTASAPLAGQHALVTGANRGFGAAIARALSAAGAAVTLMVRDRVAAAAVAATLPGRSTIVLADVTDREAVQRGCADAAAALGAVDILVNNAGWVESIPFLKATPQTFQEMIDVHLMGAVHTAQAVLPAMVERGRGRIVNIASFAGLHGVPYVAHYVAAKHALVGLTRSLALEFAAKGITVNAVCPGYSETDLVSGSIVKISAKTGRSVDEARQLLLADAGQPRMVHPTEVAEAVLAFARPDAAARNGETTVLMGEDPQ
jgi:NAD(P)-dependent dehydrogenase (short-subunit alcohol dehydrogenase family)